MIQYFLYSQIYPLFSGVFLKCVDLQVINFWFPSQSWSLECFLRTTIGEMVLSWIGNNKHENAIFIYIVRYQS